MEKFFFENGWSLLQVLVVGVIAYAALLVILRVSGKRTLSKMNAFDFVVTVALGSTLATVLLSKDVTLAEGVLAFGLLAWLQYVVAWSSVRSRWVNRLISLTPPCCTTGGTSSNTSSAAIACTSLSGEGAP